MPSCRTGQHTVGFANSLWCLIPRCLTKIKTQSARLDPVENTAVVPGNFGTPGGLSKKSKIPQQPDLVSIPQGQDFLTQQGVPQLIAWPISGNPIHHKVFLTRLQTSCSSPGETKLTHSSFAKWSNWCQQRNQDPLLGPIEDAVNFLASSFSVKGLGPNEHLHLKQLTLKTAMFLL